MSRSLLKHDNLVSAPIQEGDAGLILKPDGSFKVFSTGKIDAADLTPEQQAQGEKLVAMIVALQNPQVMDLLMSMSKDPAIVGEGVDLGKLH